MPEQTSHNKVRIQHASSTHAAPHARPQARKPSMQARNHTRSPFIQRLSNAASQQGSPLKARLEARLVLPHSRTATKAGLVVDSHAPGFTPQGDPHQTYPLLHPPKRAHTVAGRPRGVRVAQTARCPLESPTRRGACQQIANPETSSKIA